MYAVLISTGNGSLMQVACRNGYTPWKYPCIILGYNPYFASCRIGSIPCYE